MRLTLSVAAPLALVLHGSCAAPEASRKLDRQYDYARLETAPRELSRVRRDRVTVLDVRFESPLRGDVPAYLVVPDGKGPFPVVLFGHWMMPGSPLANRGEFLEEAAILARAGAMSLLVDAPQVRPGYPVPSGEMAAVELEAEASRQLVTEFRRALDALSARDDVDSTRIAFVGHSFNAHVGAILAAVEKRIGSFVLMAGGFADERYVFDSTLASMREFRARVGDARLREHFQAYAWDDPVNFVGRSGPAAVLLQFGARDEALPVELTRGYFAMFGSPKGVEFFDAGHALDAAARVSRAAWLARRLRLGPIDTVALGRIPPLR